MYANKLALQQAIISEAVRSGDSTFEAQCGAFIRRAEQRIYKGLRPLKAREMETRTTLTVTSGVTATPADFLSARRLTWQASRPYALVYRQPEDFYDRQKDYAEPKIYTIDGTVIDIASQATGTAVLSYYAQPASLSSDLDTNAVLTAHGHVYLASALIEAFGFLRDPQMVQAWANKFAEAVDGVNLAAVKARYSGTHLSPRIAGAA